MTRPQRALWAAASWPCRQTQRARSNVFALDLMKDAVVPCQGPIVDFIDSMEIRAQRGDVAPSACVAVAFVLFSVMASGHALRWALYGLRFLRSKLRVKTHVN